MLHLREFAPLTVHVGNSKLRLSELKSCVVVIRVLDYHDLGIRERTLVRVHRLVEPALRHPDLTDLSHRGAANFDCRRRHALLVNRIEIVNRFVTNGIEHIEPADRLQLCAQIAQYEIDQALGLGTIV